MKLTTVIIATLAASSTIAAADLVDMKKTGTGAGLSVKLITDDRSSNVFAGQIEHEISGASDPYGFLNGTHYTYCADIAESVTTDLTQYEIVDLQDAPRTTQESASMGSAKSDAIRALYGNASSQLADANISNNFAAAFQITIWELVNDFDGTAGSFDLENGNVRISNTDGNALDNALTSTIDGLVSQMMTSMDNGETNFGDLVALANAGSQDQIVMVPAPGAFALLGAGGLLVGRRRR